MSDTLSKGAQLSDTLFKGLNIVRYIMWWCEVGRYFSNGVLQIIGLKVCSCQTMIPIPFSDKVDNKSENQKKEPIGLNFQNYHQA